MRRRPPARILRARILRTESTASARHEAPAHHHPGHAAAYGAGGRAAPDHAAGRDTERTRAEAEAQAGCARQEEGGRAGAKTFGVAQAGRFLETSPARDRDPG